MARARARRRRDVRAVAVVVVGLLAALASPRAVAAAEAESVASVASVAPSPSVAELACATARNGTMWCGDACAARCELEIEYRVLDVTAVAPAPSTADATTTTTTTTTEYRFVVDYGIRNHGETNDLSSWQTSWVFAANEGIRRGDDGGWMTAVSSDVGILVQPGGVGGRPTRVVNAFGAGVVPAAGGHKTFSFAGYGASDGGGGGDGAAWEPGETTEVTLNGARCVALVDAAAAAAAAAACPSAASTRLHRRFCCGEALRVGSTAGSPPPPLPSTPLPSSTEKTEGDGEGDNAWWDGWKRMNDESSFAAVILACAGAFACCCGAVAWSVRARIPVGPVVASASGGDARGDARSNARKRTLLLPGQSVATADADARGVVLAGGADWQCWTVAGGARTVATASKLSFDRPDDAYATPPSSPPRARYATVPPRGRPRTAGADDASAAAREEDPREIDEIELDDIELGALLGRGAYGTVHRGSWRRARGGGDEAEAEAEAEAEVVAVKTLHAVAGASERELRTFAREVAVLSRLSHPCVVRLLGACTRPPRVCIVEELMRGGSLYDRIHGHGGGGGGGGSDGSCRGGSDGSCRDGDGDAFGDGRGRRLTFVETMRVASDVAAAMSYLAREKVVHRDLKSHNVLLTSARGGGDAASDHRTTRGERGDGPERGVWAKVADFGIARAKGHTMLQTTRGATANGKGDAGTPAYMAPELFRGDKCDEKCDVYSFGVVLWECVTGRAPWAWLSNQMQIIFAVAVEGRRLPMREGECLASELTSLMFECWREEPRERPAFSHIEERVAAMRRRLSSL